MTYQNRVLEPEAFGELLHQARERVHTPHRRRLVALAVAWKIHIIYMHPGREYAGYTRHRGVVASPAVHEQNRAPPAGPLSS